MKRIFSSTCALFLLAVVPSPLISSDFAKSAVASRAASANRFLGVWSDSVAFNYPKSDPMRSQSYKLLEVSPRGRCRLIEVRGNRRTQMRSSYRIVKEQLVAIQTYQKPQLPKSVKNPIYLAAIRTYYRFSGPNCLVMDRRVVECVNDRDKSVRRVEWKGGQTFWRIKSTNSSFQFL